MGQTFRRWQLCSLHRGTAVDGKTGEQGWRMKAVWLQQDHRASNHSSGAEEQQRVPGSASELRSSCLGREGACGLTDENDKSDSALFWLLTSFLLFFFFSNFWLYYVSESKDWRLLLTDTYTVCSISTHGWKSLWHWAWLLFSFQLDVGRLL